MTTDGPGRGGPADRSEDTTDVTEFLDTIWTIHEQP